jgi:hypothetical protein
MYTLKTYIKTHSQNITGIQESDAAGIIFDSVKDFDCINILLTKLV